MSGNNEHLGSAANGGGEAVGRSPECELGPEAQRVLGVLAVKLALEARYRPAMDAYRSRQERGQKAFEGFSSKFLTREALAASYQEAMQALQKSIEEKQERPDMRLSTLGVEDWQPVEEKMVEDMIEAGILYRERGSGGSITYKLNWSREEAEGLLKEVKESCEDLDPNAETYLNGLTIYRFTETTENAEGEEVRVPAYSLCVQFRLSGKTVDSIERMQDELR